MADDSRGSNVSRLLPLACLLSEGSHGGATGRKQLACPSRVEHPSADDGILGCADMSTPARKGFQSLHAKTAPQVGIREFVNSSTIPFSGILKQRFSDFQVNEVR